MSVSTGIDSAHLDEVKELVEQQPAKNGGRRFRRRNAGNRSEMLINSILASEDDPLSMINREFQNAFGTGAEAKEISDAIRGVDRGSDHEAVCRNGMQSGVRI